MSILSVTKLKNEISTDTHMKSSSVGNSFIDITVVHVHDLFA